MLLSCLNDEKIEADFVHGRFVQWQRYLLSSLSIMTILVFFHSLYDMFVCVDRMIRTI
jgi:hypothetical protein